MSGLVDAVRDWCCMLAQIFKMYDRAPAQNPIHSETTANDISLKQYSFQTPCSSVGCDLPPARHDSDKQHVDDWVKIPWTWDEEFASVDLEFVSPPSRDAPTPPLLASHLTKNYKDPLQRFMICATHTRWKIPIISTCLWVLRQSEWAGARGCRALELLRPLFIQI